MNTKTKTDNDVARRVRALNELAAKDPQAAQDAVWAWLARLGEELPSAEAHDELMAIYAASAPADVDGYTAGMLVGFIDPEGLDQSGRILFRVVKAVIALAPTLPWLGKKFDQDAQRGTNAVAGLAVAAAAVVAPRYRLSKVGDHWEGFEMLNRIEESVISPGTDILVLDYEADEVANPWPINQIRDEAVQVVPGTYLGSKLLRQSAGYAQLAWWASKSEVN